MKFNLKKEYPEADFENIETMKQVVINKFKDFGINVSKIKNARILLKNGKPDGIFIYHPFASIHNKNCREIIEKKDTQITYRRYKEQYRSDWISTENFEDYENMLEMVIHEAITRKNCLI